MQTVQFHRLPIVLVLVAFSLVLVWGAAEARPSYGLSYDAGKHIKQKAEVLSGDPDSPQNTPTNSGTGQRSLVRGGGGDLPSGTRTRSIWVVLLWMGRR
jgi:hypothetical protein